MEIRLDFDYDDDVAELYHQAINYEFTSEFRAQPRLLTLDQVKTRLHEISKSKVKNGYDIHGILKVYINNKLAAISFPRQLIPSEYDDYSLKATKEYHRLSGIFIHDDYRGQGLGLKVLQWFIEKYKFVLWTADLNNHGSIKVAQKAQLNEIKEVDVFAKIDEEEKLLYSLKIFAN